jgi:hypothetical protein
MAFIIWDVGTRPPGQLLHDIGGTLRWSGLWRFLLGLIVLCAGAALMLSVTLVDIRHEFLVLETIAIAAGLLVEMLVGTTVRAHIYSR